MAEHDNEDIEELKKVFESDFEDTLKRFKETSKILNKNDLGEIIQKIESRKDSLYKSFKELASTKLEHGNDVPLVMAYAMATNAAHDVLSSIVAGVMTDVPMPILIGMTQASLYHKFIAPYAMLMWERLQSELIDEELKATK